MNLEFLKISAIEIWDVSNIPEKFMYPFFAMCQRMGVKCVLAPYPKNPFNMVERILITMRVEILPEQLEEFKISANDLLNS